MATINYPDKVTGDQVSAEEMNEIKSVVNENFSSGSTDVAFTESIPFNYNNAVMKKKVTEPLEFTPNKTNAKGGNSAMLRLVADGVNIPVFTGFNKFISSDAWDNTFNRVHEIFFMFNGEDYNYSIQQAQVLDIGITSIVATNSHTIVASFNEAVTGTAAGWIFKQNGVIINPSSVTGSGTSQLTFIFGDTLLETDVLLASYDALTGDITDAASHTLEGFTDQEATNQITAFIFSDDFISEDLADIDGRVTPIGSKVWVKNVVGDSPIGIISNTAGPTAAGTGSDYLIDIEKSDVVLTARKASSNSSGGLYLKVMQLDRTNYVQVELTSLNTYQYSDALEGGYSLLNAGSGVTAIGQVVKLVLVGDSLGVYRDDELIFTVTLDLTNTGTKVGLFSYDDATTRIDLLTVS